MQDETPTGFMKWIAINGGNSEKVLHIKLGKGDQYKPYTVFPGLMQPNFRVPSLNPHEKPIPSSKGFATAQLLLKRGFVYESSDPVVDEEVEGDGGAIGVLRDYMEKADVLG